MNGLQFIRNKSNMSLEDLANQLKISKQAISSWENNRKEIPEKRKKQLAQFFRIDTKYLKELSDSELEELSKKAMVKRDVNGKEVYLYYDELKDDQLHGLIYFFDKDEVSPSQEYRAALQIKKEYLNRVEKFIDGPHAEDLMEKAFFIKRGCKWLDYAIRINECANNYKSSEKVAAKYEMINMLIALEIFFGNRDISEFLENEGSDKKYIGTDTCLIKKILDVLKVDWEEKCELIEEDRRRLREERQDCERE